MIDADRAHLEALARIVELTDENSRLRDRVQALEARPMGRRAAPARWAGAVMRCGVCGCRLKTNRDKTRPLYGYCPSCGARTSAPEESWTECNTRR